MKKLYILKTVVDFLWIISLFAFPLIIFLTIYFIWSDEVMDIPIQITTHEIDLTSKFGKIALAIGVLNSGLLLYAVFLFRKLLTNFRKRLIFETENMILFDKIGNLVLLASVVYIITDFVANTSINHLQINFGYGPFLYLLGLGLFFKVLAEVFKMGKNLKDENELTI